MRRRKQLSSLTLAVLVVLFTAALVIFPKPGLESATAGLKVFWDVVFPSLLPFFILSELLLGLGVVNALGVVLEPLMRPLFSVPGVGAFALSMGLAAGYPMDAVITARFRKNGLCSRIEGERLLAFTNTADPLFMFGAVAVGMFGYPALGALLAVAHYISSFIVGLTFKLYGRREERNTRPQLQEAVKQHGFLLKRAYLEMMKAKNEDNRPFGRLLGDAVNDSIKTLLMIGGFIVFFSVFLRVLAQIGVVTLAAVPLTAFFQVLHLDPSLVRPFITGLFEIDLGSAATANATAPLIEKVTIVSAIIAWSGLSVHAQVASVLTDTDIRMRPYFIARIYHAVLAGVITYLLYQTGFGTEAAFIPRAIATMAPLSAGAGAHWAMSLDALGTWALVLAAATVISLTVYIVHRLRVFSWRSRLD
ncbi:MAG: sporulation integral membrane protein YlbJ [Firmicutes bacterium]|nr:sporulation integral membrane protein YlbJ [Bacillota bacterium]